MIPSLLQTLRSMGPALSTWAVHLHTIAVSLLVLAWFSPLVEAIVAHFFRTEAEREADKKASEIEWVRLWMCPECSTYNRRSFTNCTHCEYALKTDDAGTLWGRIQEW